MHKRFLYKIAVVFIAIVAGMMLFPPSARGDIYVANFNPISWTVWTIGE